MASSRFYVELLLIRLPVLLALTALYLIKIMVRPFYRELLAKRRLPLVVRTPEERFRGIERLGYTFKANYVQLAEDLPRVSVVTGEKIYKGYQLLQQTTNI